MPDYSIPRACRHCGGALLTLLDFGPLAVSTFPPLGDTTPLPTSPLTLGRCVRCRMVQLRDTVAPERLYRHYWYQSGVNEVMRAELDDIVRQALAYTHAGRGAHVVDVGANDGTLLAAYAAHRPGLFRTAFEPADNLWSACRRHCEQLIPTLFPGGTTGDALTGRVKILTSIACFYDVDRPHAFLHAVSRLLARDGVWIVQFQDLAHMVQATAFDNLCHEHLVYYTLASFEALLTEHGLRVFAAETRAINGGSYRLYVCREDADYALTPSVAKLREWEAVWTDGPVLEHFARRTQRVIEQVREVVRTAPGPVDLYGASTKANTLLQLCRFGPADIRQAWERSEAKVGRQTVTGIPIVREDAGREDPPALLLCGIWQFRDAVIARERAYLAAGGRLVFPLPSVDIVQGVTA